MKNKTHLLALVLLLGLSLACSAINRSESPATEVVSTTSEVTSSGTDEMQITVKNYSPEPVCYVYISLSTSDDWGEDWLGDTLATGDSETFTLPEGTYDVDVDNCDGAVMGSAWEVSSSMTLDIGSPEATVLLLVENATSSDICYVLVSPPSNDEWKWDDDQLGAMEQIPVGGQRLIFLEPGVYDMMAEDCDENILLEEYEVDLTSDMVWTVE